MTLEPMPRMSAPIFTSMRARSTTCGSLAALKIWVSPGVSAAAIRAFSVPITDGSSMKISPARSVPASFKMVWSCCSIRAPSALNASRCGSRRRRPMTSPPGGGMSARPKRASSGPASRNEARMRAEIRGSTLRLGGDAGGADRDLVLPAPLHGGAEVLQEVEHRLDVADARDVAHDDLVRGQRGRGEAGQGGVLVAGRDDRAGQRSAPVDDELLHAVEAPRAASRSGVRALG